MPGHGPGMTEKQGPDWGGAPSLDVEAEVEGRGGVGDPAGGDVVDAGLGDGADRLQGDVARGLEDGVAGDDLDRLAEQRRGHVVEEDDVGVGVEGLPELLDRVDLDLDLHEMPGKGARLPDRRLDAAGHGDVV